MEQSVLNASSSETARAELEQLVSDVVGYNDPQSELLQEHLQSAKTYLLGAMPEEYEFSLLAAKKTAGELVNTEARSACVAQITHLMDQAANAHAAVQTARPVRPDNKLTVVGDEKSQLYRFFHGSATTLGVFHPTYYIFASFPSFQSASKAAQALRAEGYRDLVSASASETRLFMEEIRADVGIWGAVMSSISRFLGTEEVFTDIDVNKADDGAGFLAMYCPRAKHAEHIREVVAPFEPQAMQLYLPSGVQSLIAGKSPGPQGNHPDQN